MPSTEASAPVLSTPQDDAAFTYAKVNKAETIRSHLHLGDSDNYLQKLHQYYSLGELAALLASTEPSEDGTACRKFHKITLQFPDSLICDSASIVQELQKTLRLTSADIAAREPDTNTNTNTNTKGSCTDQEKSSGCKSGCSGPGPGAPQTADSVQRLWILADTSYSACCIDEVAAGHVDADLVVHFGDACLNPVASLASAYVFGKPQLDLAQIAREFETRYPLAEFQHQKIVLMADAPHTYLLPQLAARLGAYQVVVTDLVLNDANSRIIGYQPRSADAGELQTLSRSFTNVFVDENDVSPLAEYELFHIGLPEAPRLLQLTTKFQAVTTFHDGKVSQGPYPNLMRRYRYMHMARSAGTVGILVNTLSLANTKKLVNQLAKKIRDAGKKHYIFVVGKPNVAKLANFDAVDLWCVLGCDHQGIILDQTSEYYKPIITPYELLLAIGDEFSWTGQWVTDFRKVLEDMGGDDEEEKEKEEKTEKTENGTNEQESDEEPEFNPVTGQYTSAARPLRRLQHLRVTMNEAESSEDSPSGSDANAGAIVKKLSGAVVLRNTVSTSAAHLQTREWTGLGSDWTDDVDAEGATVEEGTSGIARGYQFDVANQNP